MLLLDYSSLTHHQVQWLARFGLCEPAFQSIAFSSKAIGVHLVNNILGEIGTQRFSQINWYLARYLPTEIEMRTGALFTLAAGIALAHADAGGAKHSGAIHPYAKYKSLVMGADAVSATTTSAPTPTSTPARPALECFQVAEPVLTPAGVTRRDSSHLPALASADQVPIEAADGRGGASSAPCAVVLMEHTFANSYGAPFVGM